MRGATKVKGYKNWEVLFQSTHPMRGATCKLWAILYLSVISIHASHARCDATLKAQIIGFTISIHAPHARCDRRAVEFWVFRNHFNPRTPCEVRLPTANNGSSSLNFNPRTPCEVRPPQTIDLITLTPISIHAPHARCDYCLPCMNSWLGHFNPRTPCEVRQIDTWDSNIYSEFQSTHPMRGATCTHQHSPTFSRYFNPRTPCEVRHDVTTADTSSAISIHAPHARCDKKNRHIQLIS